MSKYDPLARHLSEIRGESTTMTFQEIDALVVGGLPQSAYDHRPWWANRHDGKDAQNKGWQTVGWESTEVEMDLKQVTFRRVSSGRTISTPLAKNRPLSIDEAKNGLSLNFGVPVESIEILIKG